MPATQGRSNADRPADISVPSPGAGQSACTPYTEAASDVTTAGCCPTHGKEARGVQASHAATAAEERKTRAFLRREQGVLGLRARDRDLPLPLWRRRVRRARRGRFQDRAAVCSDRAPMSAGRPNIVERELRAEASARGSRSTTLALQYRLHMLAFAACHTLFLSSNLTPVLQYTVYNNERIRSLRTTLLPQERLSPIAHDGECEQGAQSSIRFPQCIPGAVYETRRAFAALCCTHVRALCVFVHRA